jgi:hypothetical protein
MRETPKTFVAAAVAGITGAASFAIYANLVDGSFHEGVGHVIGTFGAAVLPFEFVSFLLGWPIYVVASSFGRARWWLAVIAGLALGGLFSLLLGMASWVAFPIIGAVAGGAYWLTLRSFDSAVP